MASLAAASESGYENTDGRTQAGLANGEGQRVAQSIEDRVAGGGCKQADEGKEGRKGPFNQAEGDYRTHSSKESQGVKAGQCDGAKTLEMNADRAVLYWGHACCHGCFLTGIGTPSSSGRHVVGIKGWVSSIGNLHGHRKRST
jgi:hypothetical protein